MIKGDEDLNKEIIDEIKKIGIKNILVDEPMKNHTTFRIGGPADIMVSPENEEELCRLVKCCRARELSFLVMGNGSNMLVRDGGIRGLVIRLNDNFAGIEVQEEENIILAKSGALLSKLSRTALKHSLKGLEFASGIPGALGGAITMNAGAYGGEMKDVVRKVKVLDREGNIQLLNLEELELGYRTSRVKREKLIVLEVEMHLEAGNQDEIDSLMKDYTERRTSKQPLEWASGGSTFKRPEGYFAGKLIDDSGLRGLRYKDAQVSEKHCGFIINRGKASCEDILELVETVQKIVKDKFGVDLEREIMLIGDE